MNLFSSSVDDLVRSLWSLVDEAKLAHQSHQSRILQLLRQTRVEQVILIQRALKLLGIPAILAQHANKLFGRLGLLARRLAHSGRLGRCVARLGEQPDDRLTEFRAVRASEVFQRLVHILYSGHAVA